MPDSDELTLPEKEGPAEREESLLRWLGETAVLVVVAFLLAMGMKQYVVQPFVIPSGSMEPTLLVGDRVLVNKFVYRLREPATGDVVVFLSPDSSKVDYIKRVIAVAGQTVEVRDGVVYVDGKPRSEPFVNGSDPDTYSSDGPTTVPPGHVWLMGDNRGNSHDSRYFGPRPVKDLLGDAFAIYWPLTRLRTL